MWSFVGYKGNKLWKELTIDALTKEILGLQIGSRVETGGRGLWDSLVAVYRQRLVSYTDFGAASKKVFPRQRHKSVGKDTGKTSEINERFNNTPHQRISRLVRKTLFSSIYKDIQ